MMRVRGRDGWTEGAGGGGREEGGWRDTGKRNPRKTKET